MATLSRQFSRAYPVGPAFAHIVSHYYGPATTQLVENGSSSMLALLPTSATFPPLRPPLLELCHTEASQPGWQKDRIAVWIYHSSHQQVSEAIRDRPAGCCDAPIEPVVSTPNRVHSPKRTLWAREGDDLPRLGGYASYLRSIVVFICDEQGMSVVLRQDVIAAKPQGFHAVKPVPPSPT